MSLATGTDLTVPKLMEELYPIAAQWDILGRKLGVEDCQLEIIAADHQLGNNDASMRRLNALLRKWHCNTPDGTWSDIISALNSKEMSKCRLAETIKDKYCSSVQPSEKVAPDADSEDHNDGARDTADIDGNDEDRISDRDRPNLLTLKNFKKRNGEVINITEAIGTKYNDLGTILLEDSDGSKVEALELKHQRRASAMNESILIHWIRGEGVQPITWEKLIKILRAIKLVALADDIRESLCCS